MHDPNLWRERGIYPRREKKKKDCQHMHTNSHKKKKKWLTLGGRITSIIFTFHSVLSLCIFQVFYNHICIVSLIRKRKNPSVKDIDICGEFKTPIVF